MAFYNGFSTIGLDNKWKLGDVELVKRDILNQFQTRRGERLMNPEFGSVIWELMFEQMDEDIREAIIDDAKRIVSSDPRVVARAITVQEFEHGFQIEMDLYLVDRDISSALFVQFNQRAQILTSI